MALARNVGFAGRALYPDGTLLQRLEQLSLIAAREMRPRMSQKAEIVRDRDAHAHAPQINCHGNHACTYNLLDLGRPSRDLTAEYMQMAGSKVDLARAKACLAAGYGLTWPRPASTSSGCAWWCSTRTPCRSRTTSSRCAT